MKYWVRPTNKNCKGLKELQSGSSLSPLIPFKLEFDR